LRVPDRRARSLNVRPIWHQHPERVQAHILVCFLAFVLWKGLEMWQQRAGLGNSPRTVLEELARIQSHDGVLPTATHGQIRLRCITQPDAAQAALLDRLGIVLPKRMRLAEHGPSALAASAWPLPPDRKCSADFSANPLIRLELGVDSAQVGLGQEEMTLNRHARPCGPLWRASTSNLEDAKDVDGRDKPRQARP
jgi:hypothetical protein